MSEEFATKYKTCEMTDLFSVKEGAEDITAFTEDCNEYLKQFAFPTSYADGRDFSKTGAKTGFGVCIKCGEEWNGMMAAMGMGYAVRWGLAHGEGNCGKCGWPVRGKHYPKDRNGKEMFTLSNGFLCYHPDIVEKEWMDMEKGPGD